MSSKTAVVNTEAFRHLIMSQQGRRKTKRLLDFHARNQFGTPGGEKSFLRGDSFLKLCPMVSKYVQHNFPVWTKIFLGGLRPLLGTDLWTSIHHKKQMFSCVLYAHSQFLCGLVKFDLANQGLRQPVQPHTFNVQLLVFDETLVQPQFAVVNCSDVGMSVFHSHVLTRSLIFCSYGLLCRSVEFIFLR